MSDYVPMFDDATLILTTPFYLFEQHTRSRRLNNFSLYVKHCYHYRRILAEIAEWDDANEDMSIVSLEFQDGQDYYQNDTLTLSQVAYNWNLLNIQIQKAWRFRANKLNARPPICIIKNTPHWLKKKSKTMLLFRDMQHCWD